MLKAYDQNVSEVVFKSKIGWNILIPTLALVMVVGFLPIFQDEVSTASVLVAFAMVLMALIIILPPFINTTYTITAQGVLEIRSSFWYRQSIPIQDITKIKPSTSWLASPAPSLDRLAIHHGKFSMALVSPEDKIGFIEALKARKDGILVLGDLENKAT